VVHGARGPRVGRGAGLGLLGGRGHGVPAAERAAAV
jgi:hypothetical protein